MELILPIAVFTFIYWIYPILVLMTKYVLLPRKIHRIKYCCMVRPWHIHLVGDIKHVDEGFITEGFSGIIFSVTDRNLSPKQLGRTLAHENRHVTHALFGGIIYQTLYSISDRFSRWVERDCERAESNPLKCKSL